MNEVEQYFNKLLERVNTAGKSERFIKLITAGETALGSYPYVITRHTWSDRIKAMASLSDHYCGYVGTKTRFTETEVELMDVHGGVTYTEMVGNLMIIGFDCAHVGDDRPEIQNVEYVRGEIDGGSVVRKEREMIPFIYPLPMGNSLAEKVHAHNRSVNALWAQDITASKIMVGFTGTTWELSLVFRGGFTEKVDEFATVQALHAALDVRLAALNAQAKAA
jgi:hypothetical protein